MVACYLFFVFKQLAFDFVDSTGDGFLEFIAMLFSEEGLARYCQPQFHDLIICLTVPLFSDLQVNFGFCYPVRETSQFADFLLDNAVQVIID